MPELRKDPVSGRWVIIATSRSQRPNDFSGQSHPARSGDCPFCEGNEQQTPPEILAYRKEGAEPNSPGWSVRVVPNKFPALQVEGELEKEGEGIYDHMNGIGAHEVIIESPRHEPDVSRFSPERMEDVLRAYVERIRDLRRDRRFKYILIFKNQGEAAGASLEHAHSQLIALPIVPKNVLEELNGSRNHYEHKERCIFCDMLRHEREEGQRLVEENEGFTALEPYAPRFPFETWVVPKTHSSCFETIDKGGMQSLSRILISVLRKLDRALNRVPFNYIIHTSPLGELNPYYHWHVEIMPKLTHVAGFEWGTGFYINPTLPEEAAEFLRQVET